ncbi:ribonuclease P/MRP protein subunit POP5 isoform X2 [Daktulosphaira vitifoliae]|uniref:ribonuclease P/MRP protein subunit POP5 isoform X2 n=1 Tax=Daktulosphaira vitifoliae TaxID=58002 RepID=UPI0021AABD95|nr:ribonuclease P/MRP protein subunit POP5 isoform X2 [Daktulosphaira vitifoliae]
MVRYKNRYLVVQLNILSNDNDNFKISNRDLQSGVLDVIKVLYGDFGAGAIRTCFKVHYCNPTTKIIIFKTRHGPHIYLSSAIPFINKLQNTRIKLSTIYLGASVFHCYKFIQVIYDIKIIFIIIKKISLDKHPMKLVNRLLIKCCVSPVF